MFFLSKKKLDLAMALNSSERLRAIGQAAFGNSSERLRAI